MKKSTILGLTAAALGAAAWYVSANRRQDRVELIRREVKRLLAVRRDELNALRTAAAAGEMPEDLLGPVPLGGVELDSIRLEHGMAAILLRGHGALAVLSSEPLDLVDVRALPWRGSARPGVLYTEYLGDGWYAGYACQGWR